MPKAVAGQLDFGRVEPWGPRAERSSEPGGEIGPRPDSLAKRASWTRLESPSLRKMVVRCAFTVCSVIVSRFAIFLLLAPSPISKTTSRSRGGHLPPRVWQLDGSF